MAPRIGPGKSLLIWAIYIDVYVERAVQTWRVCGRGDF